VSCDACTGIGESVGIEFDSSPIVILRHVTTHLIFLNISFLEE